MHLIYHTKGSTEFYQDHFSLLPTSIAMHFVDWKRNKVTLLSEYLFHRFFFLSGCYGLE